MRRSNVIIEIIRLDGVDRIAEDEQAGFEFNKANQFRDSSNPDRRLNVLREPCFGPDLADLIIGNNGTIPQFQARLKRLMLALGVWRPVGVSTV